MKRIGTPGPSLEALTRRLAGCPAEFLAEPRVGERGELAVAALVGDLLAGLGAVVTAQDLDVFRRAGGPVERNWLRTVAIAAWLLNDGWFRGHAGIGGPAYRFLTGALQEIAALTAAPQFVLDADRREELVRMCLKELGFRPEGETQAQAEDRLTTLSAAERQRVIRAARQAEARAAAVRAAMAKQAAEEAAMKAARE